MPLLLLLIKATLLLVAALMATLVMQRASAGSRHVVWFAALAMLLMLPALAVWSPLHLQLLPAVAQPGAGANVGANGGAATIAAPLIGTLSPITPVAGTDIVAPSHTNLVTLVRDHLFTSLALLWAVVALTLLGWLSYGAFAVRRIVRRAVPLSAPEWQGPLYEIADRLGLDAAPRLVRSEDVKMPFACGVMSATIVLPAESDDWSADRRSAVLIHELGHVRRRDLFGHTVGRVACAFYWFHPLVWSAARHLRAESERACDDLALLFGARPSDYAEHLLDIVTCVRDHATPSIALALAHRKEFEGRMLAILNPDLRRVLPARWQTVSLVASFATVALLISAAAPVRRPTVVDVPSGPVTQTPSRDLAVHAPIAPPAAAQRPGHTANAKPEPAAEPANDTSGPTPARGELFARMLRTDSSPSVRRVAAWALRDYDSLPAATAALTGALAHDADESVREMSAWTLAQRDGGSNAALATALRDDKSSRVRETAVWGIGEQGDAALAEVISRALEGDRNMQVRGTAAWALGQMGLSRAPTALLSALRDSARDVRYKAVWAVAEIGDSAALPSLRAMLRREADPDLQRMELRALIHCNEDPEQMVEWLKSSDAGVRQMALKALAGGSASDPWPWPWPRPRPMAQ
ncbi:MAG TPA: M56 family metallopeptidase [Gemmatimonadales bacterium]|jgi:beta-lactamase regulating signal transducer with metallopeptidase domain